MPDAESMLFEEVSILDAGCRLFWPYGFLFGIGYCLLSIEQLPCLLLIAY